MDAHTTAPPPPLLRPVADQAAELEHALSQSRRWISDAQASAPGLPDDLSAQGLPVFLLALDTWWQAPHASGTGESLERGLATHIATTMRDDARLRALDGTLSTADLSLIVSVTQSQGHIVPAGVTLRDVLFDGVAYPAALIVAHASEQGGALLFMPDRGWDRFPSLGALHRELEERTRRELVVRDTLPGLRVAHADNMVRLERFIDSRPSGGTIFRDMAHSIASMQREQVTDAWGQLVRGETQGSVADAVRAALDLHAKLDVDAMRIDRRGAAAAAENRMRLAGVPADVREGWLRVSSELHTQGMEGLRTLQAAGATDMPTLPEAFASADAVRSYRDALLTAFDPRRAGRVRRDVATRLLRARMAMATADARLGYYLPGDRRGFRDDHAERGYRWMRAIIDAPAASGRRRVEGHEVVVRQFTYRGAVVSDLFSIGVRQPDSVSRVILYTPDAPDGRTLREFDDAAQAAREFLYNPRFEGWLLDRLPASHGSLNAHGARHFALPEGTRRIHWVVGTAAGDGTTATAEAFGEREVPGNHFDAAYASVVSRMVLDLSELEDSLRDASNALAWRYVGMVQEALAAAPNMIREVLGGVGQGLRAVWRIDDALRSRDYGQAFIDATEAYVNLLGLLPVAHASARPLGFLRALHPAQRPGQLAGIPAPAMPFDARYRAAGIDLHGVRPDARGLHVLGTRRFILSSGTPFEVRFDRASGVWRLMRQGAADATFTGPAIRWSGSAWELRPHFGLRGGRVTQSGPPLIREASLTVQEADLAHLSADQRGVFGEVLRQRLGGVGGDELLADVGLNGGRPFRVSAAQREAWEHALDVANRAPRTAPAPLVRPLVITPPWRVVPPVEWPDSVWYYTVDRLDDLTTPTLYLRSTRLPGTGTTGLVTSSIDPALRQAGTGVRPPRWVQVHLDRLRGAGPDGGPALRVLADDNAASPRYFLQPSGLGAPGMLVLRPGEFTVGPPALP